MDSGTLVPWIASAAASASPRCTCAAAARPGAAQPFPGLVVSFWPPNARLFLPPPAQRASPPGHPVQGSTYRRGARSTPRLLLARYPHPQRVHPAYLSDQPCPLQEKGVRSASLPSRVFLGAKLSPIYKGWLCFPELDFLKPWTDHVLSFERAFLSRVFVFFCFFVFFIQAACTPN